ncbi:MAG: hypothetical protein DRJ64_00640 [Thermoprotei archaeon]|nr:MAG: hypothetical protein DRJ64_00640 [Thermoprotei archaeon]
MTQYLSKYNKEKEADRKEKAMTKGDALFALEGIMESVKEIDFDDPFFADWVDDLHCLDIISQTCVECRERKEKAMAERRLAKALAKMKIKIKISCGHVACQRRHNAKRCDMLYKCCYHCEESCSLVDVPVDEREKDDKEL